jgi:hypothetical protein
VYKLFLISSCALFTLKFATVESRNIVRLIISLSLSNSFFVHISLLSCTCFSSSFSNVSLASALPIRCRVRCVVCSLCNPDHHHRRRKLAAHRPRSAALLSPCHPPGSSLLSPFHHATKLETGWGLCSGERRRIAHRRSSSC